MDVKLDEWQAAQHRVRKLEQLLAMAMLPQVARGESIDVEQVKADLAIATRVADDALQACLSEASRTRRSHKRIGLSTGWST